MGYRIRQTEELKEKLKETFSDKKNWNKHITIDGEDFIYISARNEIRYVHSDKEAPLIACFAFGEIIWCFEEEKSEYNPIKGVRTHLKMTQKEFSEACFDIPIRTIQDWESGRRTPPLYLVMLIMSRLDQLGKLDKND
ncbi:MAG: helix-turn-helix domain-containing protein [Oscillospiraceae bacterium]